jgi:hypothetical protein
MNDLNNQKLFFRKQKMPLTDSLLFIAIIISYIKLYEAFSVEVLLLNQYCSLKSMLFVHTCLYNLAYIRFSKTLEKEVSNDMGL